MDKKQINGCYMKDAMITLSLGENRGNGNYKPKYFFFLFIYSCLFLQNNKTIHKLKAYKKSI